MKTLFTLLLIFFTLTSNYAQTTNLSDKKEEMRPTTIGLNNQLFTVNKVYPNPVKDFLTIELQSEESGEIQASLINILGVEVKKWDGLYLTQGEQKIKLDLSSIKSGIYFLRISKSDQVTTQVIKKI